MENVPHSKIADPRASYGDGRLQTRMFTAQRVTGAFNIAFLVLLVWIVLRLATVSRAEMLLTLQNPLVAVALALLVINVPLHMRIGMREIIEDYVHSPRMSRLALIANNAFAAMIAAIGLFSIIKIYFWG